MPIDAEALKLLVDRELECLSDARVLAHIRSLLAIQNPVLRNWDYGERGERHSCWPVLDDPGSNSSITYCESGFGPRNPWGLVWLGGDKPMSMGMDCNWYPTFLDAYFESLAATALPIWRVFEVKSSGVRAPVTDESSWDVAWERVAAFRKHDLLLRYACGHSVCYGRTE